MSIKKALMDGNEAAAYISYAFTEVAGIYPITPSSPMAEHVDAWAAHGKKNVFGQRVKVVEMQSEGGAAGAVHGSLQAGALTTTYTASQGLLLMVPNMYKIAGEMLPGVFHVSARTLSAHALSIFGDHSDVMGVRSTGFALLASSSPQEVMDLGAVSHLAAIDCSMPFLHFFDGFRTSHEIQKIDLLEYEDLKPLINEKSLDAFRKKSLNPERPVTRGTTVNPDIFFQCREACNEVYEEIPAIVENYMEKINKLTGRNYGLFNYYGNPEAESVVIAMGSVAQTAREAIDYLLEKEEKVGLLEVHLYRPFSNEHFLRALPKSVKKIAVLDRTKEPGSTGEPLYQDVCTVMKTTNPEVAIYGGRYGLSSKDTTPGQIIAVFENLKKDEPKNNFTVGIVDDVTHTSLELHETMNFKPEGQMEAVFWGMGSDGTVGANKNSIKIIGESTDLKCQAYFVYDSKKSGGLTQSHLRFGSSDIRSPYLVQEADFVACHNPSYLTKYDMLHNLKKGGVFLLNCPWETEELAAHLPEAFKREILEKEIEFYIIDATKLAQKIGLGQRTNTILQSAFFRLCPVIPLEDAIRQMKKAIYDTYFIKKGEKVVNMNYQAVDEGYKNIQKVELDPAQIQADDLQLPNQGKPEFITEVVDVMNHQKGDSLPVSVMKKYGLEDGTWPAGTSQYEKRGAAVKVPTWISENCIQCNQCSLHCPHAAIRPFLLNEEEAKGLSEGTETVAARVKSEESYQLRIQVSPYDCTGCGVCANICPAKTKALVMKDFEETIEEHKNWMYLTQNVSAKPGMGSDKNIKESQFLKPYFEFSGACAGCGETPYIKLVSQLFGDHMYVANASGCSSAYSASTPSTPYCTDNRGYGPSWAMSLFEDNAEYAFGMLMGQKAIRERIKDMVEKLVENGVAEKEGKAYLESFDDKNESRKASDVLLAALANVDAPEAEFILQNKEYVAKKSVWAIGGDGWAYDIGFGGLDQVLASGEDINILVLDTEVYSNTGGQTSKATGTGAVAKFSAGGKKTKKKDLGRMMSTYGYVYVAQVAIGANPQQTLTAIREAEAFPGPSLIICYSPCIEHGMKCGMGLQQQEQKRAVEIGYWPLYRYNPLRKEQGENPFILDSKEPKEGFRDFLTSQNRYASLALAFPEEAEKLYAKAEQEAMDRYREYKIMSEQEI